MFITTQDIVNFRNPTAEVLPVEKDFTDKSKYTVKINLMDLNFCSPTMSSFDPCLAEICKLKIIISIIIIIISPRLHATCDGCGQNFTINHALKCKAGGLLISRHHEFRNCNANFLGKSGVTQKKD